MNTLCIPADLGPFAPGALLDDAAVDAAVDAVRSAADWHIAPEVTETIFVPSRGGYGLPLKSRRIVSVAAVRNGSDTLADWSMYPGGMLYRRQGWPVGVLQVDLTHGFSACPPALLPVIAFAAQWRDPAVGSARVGGVAVTYRDGLVALEFGPLARYAAWPGIA